MAPVPRRPRARLTSQHAQDTDERTARLQKLPLLEMHAMRAVGGWRVTVTARAWVITAGFFLRIVQTEPSSVGFGYRK